MKVLRDKLRSQAGASILLALAVMLVCMMAASVVLVAATVNAGKAGGTKARERAYYSVTSAAQLFADDFSAEQPFAYISDTAYTYACQEVHPSYVHDDAGVPSEFELEFIGRNGAASPFLMAIDDALSTIDPADDTSVYETELVVKAPELDEVVAKVSVDHEYRITVDFSNVSDSVYEVKLSIPSVRSEEETTTETTLSDAHMDGWTYNEESQGLSWKETTTLNPATGAYEPASNEFGHSVEQFYEKTAHKTTRHVTWGDPVLSKGVQR